MLAYPAHKTGLAVRAHFDPDTHRDSGQAPPERTGRFSPITLYKKNPTSIKKSD